ncbi:seminal plasma protein HSP-1-like [Hemicordylus capensis]|uniref:seminal plasma protein HSP-1-like n=1 Tax=Hemicordylus capensis TaxID=884348 RepID=UPI0023027553|nr:seminal plasma protein HSP-1-like [Hemicordylus capensis]
MSSVCPREPCLAAPRLLLPLLLFLMLAVCDVNPKEPCSFPFIFKGKSYSHCTTDGSVFAWLWCSLTSNYDVDNKWRYCEPLVADMNMPCSFPFIYGGNSYSQCTTDGSVFSRFWCSLTSNYDVDFLWRYCEPSDLQEQQQEQQKL